MGGVFLALALGVQQPKLFPLTLLSATPPQPSQTPAALDWRISSEPHSCILLFIHLIRIF